MASLEQVAEQLVLLAANGTDVTSGMSASRGPMELVATIFKLLFSASALRDWAILLVIGSLFETARRLLSSSWSAFVNAFFITAAFDEYDESFQWMLLWFSRHPSWKSARNVQIDTSFSGNYTSWANLELDAVSSAHSREVTYLPAMSQSYTLWYKYHWMRITRVNKPIRGGFTNEYLQVRIMTRDRETLANILQDAKNQYIEAQKGKIAVYISDSSGNWRKLGSRPSRSLSSVILDPGITEFVVEDVRDFLSSKEWYAERGIPFRRGYLLHGAPGSGKTSLIHSIAGELGLDVYIVSLSRSGLDDTVLSELISGLPLRCIALMEDIDVAFHHGLTREPPHASSTQTPNDPGDDPDVQPGGPPACNDNRVSLSGLLNALDGIAAQEGRILFATTNKYGSLDPALCRPGRMDLHIEFKLASRFQAEELFKRFFAPSSSASASGSNHAGKRENGRFDVDAKDPLIDLSESQSQTSPPAPTPISSLSSPFSSLPSTPSSTLSLCAIEKTGDSKSQDLIPKSGPTFVGIRHGGCAPTLSHDQIEALAAQFALAVPECMLSMASLQGFLMMHKTRPFEAAAGVGAWADKELAKAS